MNESEPALHLATASRRISLLELLQSQLSEQTKADVTFFAEEYGEGVSTPGVVPIVAGTFYAGREGRSDRQRLSVMHRIVEAAGVIYNMDVEPVGSEPSSVRPRHFLLSEQWGFQRRDAEAVPMLSTDYAVAAQALRRTQFTHYDTRAAVATLIERGELPDGNERTLAARAMTARWQMLKHRASQAATSYFTHFPHPYGF